MNFLWLNTIRSRLIAGFSLLIALLITAGTVGRAALSTVSREMDETLLSIRTETALSSSLALSWQGERFAAARYLDAGDPNTRIEFQNFSLQAHEATGSLLRTEGLTSTEIGLIATIDERLSSVEIGLSQAHLLRDLDRFDAALLRAGEALRLQAGVSEDVARLSRLRSQSMDAATVDLKARVVARERFLLALGVSAILLGIATFLSTVRSISAPLTVLVAHARALSQGRLDTRTESEMPGEFQQLAEAMNTTAAALARVAGVASSTSEEVATSAHQLTSAADQVSSAATQTATAMAEVTEGAETQVSSLRDADASLQAVRERAHEVRSAAEEVADLSAEIERQAKEKRAEIARARTLLGEIRQSVDRAAAEVHELNSTAESINRFVGIVSRIAEQTNLLSLNAAIEAARAGAAGRGFAVVADEVRKLADQARAAADDVVQLTAVVTRRVGSTTEAMKTGVARVGAIESVSSGIDSALESIGQSAEQTRAAAVGLGAAADANVAAVNLAAAGISRAARTAEGHAAAAEQVSASTEEQSAACEEMSGAAAALLQGSVKLREIVAGLRTG